MRYVRFAVGEQIFWGELEEDTVHGTLEPGGTRTLANYHLADVTLMPPAHPSKIVCVGRNYAKHIKELGNDQNGLPQEPGLFLKGPNTLAAPGGHLAYPEWTQSFHYEGELAVVMGRRAHHLTRENALDYVLGYTMAIDLTARDVQKTDLQWFRAKAADGFCPLGPWIETVLDPSDLRIQTRVNGETRQDGRTSDMIFKLPDILAYVTRYVTLEPGDVVLTGTPEGVGELQRGDHIEVEIDGIGVLDFHID
ncbi:2-keto-4-pentenoate hydratase/2-oxohepta-3-ene-1,7-dioic acid hydratase in catechol pathway [Deinobacterium chartae]|uniref:2-keto-4-pentenoate hydratase/2-oxohepta-3-ene-1,7-dioic acid hydratase in catechol pathway n=1 Tax=Deinobacterium chartae TaxID=521158 RepID=A0A841I494_9DEIO|nr:fumarylacetoacetate hydrolase family protein [Deinobacterium chartae]MBB6099218.1 2-keto-4-pentenoate hydratase/2-oxohepta-3-ene-1,7-dioic acid hydratase in catechol pathway [Deinobacterium chartae]